MKIIHPHTKKTSIICGIQEIPGNTERGIALKVCAWKPDNAKSYRVIYRQNFTTNGIKTNQDTGIATIETVYFTTESEGDTEYFAVQNKQATFIKDVRLSVFKDKDWVESRRFCKGETFPCTVDYFGEVKMDIGNDLHANMYPLYVADYLDIK